MRIKIFSSPPFLNARQFAVICRPPTESIQQATRFTADFLKFEDFISPFPLYIHSNHHTHESWTYAVQPYNYGQKSLFLTIPFMRATYLFHPSPP